MKQLAAVQRLRDLDGDLAVTQLNADLNDQELSLASLKRIIPNGIYFLQDASAYDRFPLRDSLLITNAAVEAGSNTILVCDNPQLLFYQLCDSLYEKPAAEIHPTAVISERAQVGDNVSIGPYCVVGDCVIGDGTQLRNHVVIEDNVRIGKDVFVDSSSVIGAGGLAWIWDEEGSRVRQPQIGGVVVEDDVVLATDVTIVRGSLTEDTRIGSGTVIAHGTKIGHGSQVGEFVHMANNVSLAGNAVIGEFCFLGSASVISSNIRLPPHTILGASGLVTKNFDEPYLTLAGVPAKIIKRNNFEGKPSGVPDQLKPEQLKRKQS